MSSPHKEPSGSEIEMLEKSLSDLKSAVRKRNPLLRSVAESRLYPALALGSGAALVALCLVARGASITGAISDKAWGAAAVAALAAIFIVGGCLKYFLTRKLAHRFGEDGFKALMKTFYGGKAAALFATTLLSLIVGVAFLLTTGRPWYIVPLAAVFMAFAAHSLNFLVDLIEYGFLGWGSLASGLVALFFIETDPWLWTAIVCASSFCLFGAAGLVRAQIRSKV